MTDKFDSLYLNENSFFFPPNCVCVHNVQIDKNSENQFFFFLVFIFQLTTSKIYFLL